MSRYWHRVFRAVVPAGLVGATAFAASPPQAAAFFPPVRTPDDIVTVVPRDPRERPPVDDRPRPPTDDTPGGDPPTDGNPRDPTAEPVATPEPGTAASALIGLAVAARWALRRGRAGRE